MSNEPEEAAKVRAGDIHPWPNRRRLPASLVARVRLLRIALAEVHPMTFEKWLEGFERDAQPEGEIAWWEDVAARYLEYQRLAKLDENVRPVIFSLMTRLAMGMDPAEMKEFDSLPDGMLMALQVALAIDVPIDDE